MQNQYNLRGGTLCSTPLLARSNPNWNMLSGFLGTSLARGVRATVGVWRWTVPCLIGGGGALGCDLVSADVDVSQSFAHTYSTWY